MAEQDDAGRAAPPEESIESALVAARRLTGLVRNLTPLLAQLADLEHALSEFVHATRDTYAVTDAGAHADTPPSAAAVSAGDVGEAMPVQAMPAPAADASTSPDVKRTSPGGTVTLTVSAQQGALDLSRVHRAVESVVGITGLVVTSYTRGRAELLLSIAPDVLALPLGEALTAAFPNGVDAGWSSDSAFDAVVRNGS